MATIIDSTAANIIILVCCLIGLLYGVINTLILRRVRVDDMNGNTY